MPLKLPSLHAVHEVTGSPRAAGRQYGEYHAEAIEAFMHMEVLPDPKRLRYAASCWKKLQAWDKPTAEFVRGMALGSRLGCESLTLLLLHEEVGRLKNCTAIAATGPGTPDGSPIIGENWDWHPRLYPWPSILKFNTSASPAAIHYTFPGLWACAGINADGMSLVWTGAGSIPDARIKVGIPTYALVAAILARRNCRQAIDLIKNTPAAGYFIFFLADASGETCVAEGYAGRVEIVTCTDVLSRANHYECEKPARATNMRVPVEKPGVNTHLRACRMAELAQKHKGRIDASRVEKMLSDEGTGPQQNICQVPSPQRREMTLDSFYCLPVRREFWIARGLPTRHSFTCYKPA